MCIRDRHEGYIEEVETKYNCDIKFVAGIGIDDLIGQILSGQANRTILYKQPWDFYPLAQGGYLTKLNGVLDDDYWDNLPGFMSAVTKAHTYNGDIYGFGTGYDSYHVMAALGYNLSLIHICTDVRQKRKARLRRENGSRAGGLRLMQT